MKKQLKWREKLLSLTIKDKNEIILTDKEVKFALQFFCFIN